MRIFIAVLLLTFSGALLCSASPRKVDLGKRSNLLNKTTEFDTRNPRPEINSQFEGETIEFKEWHANFNSLGEKKSTLQDDRAPIKRELSDKKISNLNDKTVDFQKSPDSRRMATIGNWNNLKEQVMSSKFTNTELRTPEGRRFQEMVDEVSLQDIHRFVSQKNVTDDGIPSIKAGSGEKLSVKE